MRELNASTDQESGADDGDEDGEWGGVAEPPPADYEAEYIDEDKYTTVTVEEIDISKGRDGFMSDRDESSDEEKRDPSGRRIKENGTTTKAADKTKETKSTRTKGTTNGVKKKKKKKFTYETKAERKVGQMKVKARKKQMAQARRGKE
jgi:ribosomal RNA-processing protein 17